MIFLFLALLFILILALRYFSGRTSIHIDFYFFGVLYYLIIPGVVFNNSLILEGPGIEEWRSESEAFFENSANMYLIYVLGMISSYLLGSIFFSGFTRNQSGVEQMRRREPLRFVVGAFSFLVGTSALLSIYNSMGGLFGGYLSGYDAVSLGSIAASALVLSVFLCLSFANGWKMTRFFVGGVLSVILAVLILSGSRMYVLIPLLSVSSIYLVNTKYLKYRVRALMFFLLALALFSFVGLWRVGELDSDLIFYPFLAEPVFTSYSLISFWEFNDLPVISWGNGFVLGFANLVPSFLWPEKLEYMSSVADSGYEVFVPLGAASVVFGLVSNFGVLGSFFFLFLLGGGLQYLYFIRNNSTYFLCAYVCFVSILPFMFFRDPLFVFFKASFTIALVLFVVYGASQILRISHGR